MICGTKRSVSFFSGMTFSNIIMLATQNHTTVKKDVPNKSKLLL